MKLNGIGSIQATSNASTNLLSIPAAPPTLTAVFTTPSTLVLPVGLLPDKIYYLKLISTTNYKLFNTLADAVSGSSEIDFIDNVIFYLTKIGEKKYISDATSTAATSVDDIYHCATFPTVQDSGIVDTCTITFNGTNYILPLTDNRRFRSHWIFIDFLWTQFKVTVADKVVGGGTDPNYLSIKLEIETFPRSSSAIFVVGVTAGVVTGGNLFYYGYSDAGAGFWAPPVFDIQTGSYPSIISGATAVGVVGTGGSLTAITITNGGSGYPTYLFTSTTGFDFVRTFKYYHTATSEYYAPLASFPMSGTLRDTNEARALPVVDFVFSGSQTMPATARVYLKNAWMEKFNKYGYPDTLIDPARCATTATITLSGLQTIDTISVSAGDRVLVKNQSSGVQNGIYIVASGAWTRSADILEHNLLVMILEGTKAGKGYYLSSGPPVFVGISGITFSLWTSGVTYKEELGDIDIVCTYDLTSNRYISDVLTYYEIPGRIIFSVIGGYPLAGAAPFMLSYSYTTPAPAPPLGVAPFATVHTSEDDYAGIHWTSALELYDDPTIYEYPAGGFFTGLPQSTTFFDSRFIEDYGIYFGHTLGLRPSTTPTAGSAASLAFVFSQERRAIKSHYEGAPTSDIYTAQYYKIFAHLEDSHISSFLIDP